MDGGARIDVLHVDDDPDFADMTATFLERQDDRLSVRTALGGEEALGMLRDGAAGDGPRFDAVVSDYQMPGMDGLELLEAVRERYPALPFVLYTGKGSEEIAGEAIAAGVTDYLQKEPGTTQYELLANRVLNAVRQYRSDDRVRAQNRQYRRLFENAPVMYVVFSDEAGEPMVDDCNDRFLDRLGYERDAVLGRSIREFYDADSAERALDGFESALRGEFSSQERTLVAADGERVHTLLRASPRVDEYGEPAGTVGLYVDITERKTRERRLERLHEATREIFRSQTKEAVAEATMEAARETLNYPNTVVRLVDERGERLRPVGVTDVAVDEMGPRPLYRVDGPSPPSRAYREGEPILYEDVTEIDDPYDRGEAHAAMYLPIGEHGTISIADTDTGTFDGSDVELARILCTNAAAALDRLDWQRELRRTERRFDALFEDPDSFLGVLDVDGTLVEANRRALEFVDADLADVRGEPFPETPWWTHSPTLQDRLRGWIDRAADGEYVPFEATHRSADGEEVDIEGVVRPVTDEDGDVVSLVAEGRDVTERRARERELERRNERLDGVVKVIAHDLRGPLNAAEGHLELARAECESDGLDAVANAHGRMATLIDDLLAWARQDGTDAEAEPVDLTAVVERCWRDIDATDATFVVDTDLTVRADVTLLRQLVDNLVRNAVDHAGDGVTVRVGDLDGRDGFYVEDDGPGIPDADHERVFEPGYSTSTEGTGFGLAIVRTVADAHDWTVAVADGPDGGTRVEVGNVETG